MIFKLHLKVKESTTAPYLFLRLIHLFQQIFDENPLHAKFYARHWVVAVNKANMAPTL